MRLRIQRWGNSLALRIPKWVANESGIRQGSTVEISLVDGSLVLRPARPEFRVEDLLAGVTKANLHGEVDAGAAIGREAW